MISLPENTVNPFAEADPEGLTATERQLLNRLDRMGYCPSHRLVASMLDWPMLTVVANLESLCRKHKLNPRECGIKGMEELERQAVVLG